MIDYSDLFATHDALRAEEEEERREFAMAPTNALEEFMGTQRRNALRQRASIQMHQRGRGFARMKRCRDALEAIDKTESWTRSFHQRLFHDHFIRACARIFWKTEAPGTFARDHQKILELNGWDNLAQEILVSTPRR